MGVASGNILCWQVEQLPGEGGRWGGVELEGGEHCEGKTGHMRGVATAANSAAKSNTPSQAVEPYTEFLSSAPTQ